MTYFEINYNDVSDLVSGLKVDYEVIISDDSGRTAAGTMVMDIVARKTKLEVTFIPMAQERMSSLLKLMENYIFDVQYLDPKTKAMRTIQVYIGTPEIEYYVIHNDKRTYNGFTLSFIEL